MKRDGRGGVEREKDVKDMKTGRVRVGGWDRYCSVCVCLTTLWGAVILSKETFSPLRW